MKNESKNFHNGQKPSIDNNSSDETTRDQSSVDHPNSRSGNQLMTSSKRDSIILENEQCRGRGSCFSSSNTCSNSDEKEKLIDTNFVSIVGDDHDRDNIHKGKNRSPFLHANESDARVMVHTSRLQHGHNNIMKHEYCDASDDSHKMEQINQTQEIREEQIPESLLSNRLHEDKLSAKPQSQTKIDDFIIDESHVHVANIHLPSNNDDGSNQITNNLHRIIPFSTQLRKRHGSYGGMSPSISQSSINNDDNNSKIPYAPLRGRCNTSPASTSPPNIPRRRQTHSNQNHSWDSRSDGRDSTGYIHMNIPIQEEEQTISRQRTFSEPGQSRYNNIIMNNNNNNSSSSSQNNRSSEWSFTSFRSNRQRVHSFHSLNQSEHSSSPSEGTHNVPQSYGIHDNMLEDGEGCEITTYNSQLPTTDQQQQQTQTQQLDIFNESSDLGMMTQFRFAHNTSTINENSPSIHNQYDIEDPNREARRNWIRINQRFQIVVTIVSFLMSIVLFAIMVCWVVLTSAYVISIDNECDLPLKTYFWLATMQLILDMFRNDIMRFIFRWDSTSRNQVPTKVIIYNLIYLTYAMLVLRIGIINAFQDKDNQCRFTATALYNTTKVFVSISLSAWLLVLFGYFLPFCIVTLLLTRNGYSPAAEIYEQRNFGVFPLSSSSGAPPGCIERLKVIAFEELAEEYPTECCICMGEFCSREDIIVTECEHIFHKRCCQEWLKQARTCPVCRSDIPRSLGIDDSEGAVNELFLSGGLLHPRGLQSQDLLREFATRVNTSR